MSRVCEFEMDNVHLKLAAMSINDAEKFTTTSRKYLQEVDKVTPEQWVTLEIEAVCTSLKKAMGDQAPSEEVIRADFDLALVNALCTKLLTFSGLRTSGEVRAVSDSPKSAAA